MVMILITGWSGNTGSFVLKQIQHRFSTKKIVGVSRRNDLNQKGIILENVDLYDEKKVRELFQKYTFELIIHIANIRFSPLLMQLANEYGVKHVVLVHTTGIYSKYQSYSALYKRIENDILSKSYPKTNYTILRPTMIYGNMRDHNMHRLIRFISKYPVYPLFGNGSSLMQPIHVEDLADAIVSCIYNEKTFNNSYDLSGGSILSYKEILTTISKLLNKKIIFMHVPLPLAISIVRFINVILKKKSPITVEQVERLQEDKSYSHDAAAHDFNFKPRTFLQGVTQEIDDMRKEGYLK